MLTQILGGKILFFLFQIHNACKINYFSGTLFSLMKVFFPQFGKCKAKQEVSCHASGSHNIYCMGPRVQKTQGAELRRKHLATLLLSRIKFRNMNEERKMGDIYIYEFHSSVAERNLKYEGRESSFCELRSLVVTFVTTRLVHVKTLLTVCQKHPPASTSGG